MTDLISPTAEALDDFSDNSTDDYGTSLKEQAIQQAMDLLWLATEITEQPTDARIARIVNWGILDMAWALLIKTESKTESNSPFSGERIGSYSYQKTRPVGSYGRARQAISKGLMAGVEWFDTAVALLRNPDSEQNWVTTEQVFTHPYVEQIWGSGMAGFGHDPNQALWGPTS